MIVASLKDLSFEDQLYAISRKLKFLSQEHTKDLAKYDAESLDLNHVDHWNAIPNQHFQSQSFSSPYFQQFPCQFSNQHIQSVSFIQTTMQLFNTKCDSRIEFKEMQRLNGESNKNVNVDVDVNGVDVDVEAKTEAKTRTKTEEMEAMLDAKLEAKLDARLEAKLGDKLGAEMDQVNQRNQEHDRVYAEAYLKAYERFVREVGEELSEEMNEVEAEDQVNTGATERIEMDQFYPLQHSISFEDSECTSISEVDTYSNDDCGDFCNCPDCFNEQEPIEFEYIEDHVCNSEGCDECQSLRKNRVCDNCNEYNDLCSCNNYECKGCYECDRFDGEECDDDEEYYDDEECYDDEEECYYENDGSEYSSSLHSLLDAFMFQPTFVSN